MALTTVGTAKNAVMILLIGSSSSGSLAANLRGTSYSVQGGWSIGGSGISIMRGSTALASGGNQLDKDKYVRITAQDSSLKVDIFSSLPPITDGTPLQTLNATDTTYLINGTWQYDNAGVSLVSFTSLDVTSYTVNYNANGGSVTPTSVVYSGTPLTLPTPTRAGYTFNGWYTAASGGTKVNSPYTPTANITLYAQWTLITYSVTYDANGGSGTAPAIQSGSSSYIVATNTFTRSGYVFNGWNTAVDGTGTSYSEGSNITPSSNTMLYAQWASTTPENTIHVQDSAKATNVYVEEVLAQHFYIQDVQVF